MRYNTENFIKRAKEIHGNKYDYSKVNCINARTKVCIICLVHGEFWQEPIEHLKGSGCKLCKKQVYDTQTFVKRAKEIHGNKYDYSRVEYINNVTKVCIICPVHGEFWQRPNAHLQGSGCLKCGYIKRAKNTKKNTKWFIKRSKEIHGDKYDYSKVEYRHTMENVCIICHNKDLNGNEHGEFWQTPNRHLANHGCPKCGGNEKLITQTFIERARFVHGDKYDYSKVEYKPNKNKVCIICPKHGEFWQYTHQHLQGRGCPHCKQSSLELEIKMFLENENIKYIPQKRSKWLGRQSLDFYLPDYNIAIECQGIQHFKASDFFGGEDRYEKTKELDILKNKKCIENGVKVIYYTHYPLPYDFELISDLKTLKEKIYGTLPKNPNLV